MSPWGGRRPKPTTTSGSSPAAANEWAHGVVLGPFTVADSIPPGSLAVIRCEATLEEERHLVRFDPPHGLFFSSDNRTESQYVKLHWKEGDLPKVSCHTLDATPDKGEGSCAAPPGGGSTSRSEDFGGGNGEGSARRLPRGGPPSLNASQAGFLLLLVVAVAYYCHRVCGPILSAGDGGRPHNPKKHQPSRRKHRGGARGGPSRAKKGGGEGKKQGRADAEKPAANEVKVEADAREKAEATEAKKKAKAEKQAEKEAKAEAAGRKRAEAAKAKKKAEIEKQAAKADARKKAEAAEAKKRAEAEKQAEMEAKAEDAARKAKEEEAARQKAKAAGAKVRAVAEKQAAKKAKEAEAAEQKARATEAKAAADAEKKAAKGAKQAEAAEQKAKAAEAKAAADTEKKAAKEDKEAEATKQEAEEAQAKASANAEKKVAKEAKKAEAARQKAKAAEAKAAKSLGSMAGSPPNRPSSSTPPPPPPETNSESNSSERRMEERKSQSAVVEHVERAAAAATLTRKTAVAAADDDDATRPGENTGEPPKIETTENETSATNENGHRPKEPRASTETRSLHREDGALVAGDASHGERHARADMGDPSERAAPERGPPNASPRDDSKTPPTKGHDDHPEEPRASKEAQNIPRGEGAQGERPASVNAGGSTERAVPEQGPPIASLCGPAPTIMRHEEEEVTIKQEASEQEEIIVENKDSVASSVAPFLLTSPPKPRATIVLLIEGMTCFGCVGVVNRVLNSFDEIDSVATDLQTGTSTVSCNVLRLNLLPILTALDDVGMEACLQLSPSAPPPPPGFATMKRMSLETTSPPCPVKEQQIKQQSLGAIRRPSSAKGNPLSLMDELRQGSRPLRRYRCGCDCEGCMCSASKVHAHDDGKEITFGDLCDRLETALGTTRLEETLRETDGGTPELRDRIERLSFPCSCGK